MLDKAYEKGCVDAMDWIEKQAGVKDLAMKAGSKTKEYAAKAWDKAKAGAGAVKEYHKGAWGQATKGEGWKEKAKGIGKLTGTAAGVGAVGAGAGYAMSGDSKKKR